MKAIQSLVAAVLIVALVAACGPMRRMDTLVASMGVGAATGAAIGGGVAGGKGALAGAGAGALLGALYGVAKSDQYDCPGGPCGGGYTAYAPTGYYQSGVPFITYGSDYRIDCSYHCESWDAYCRAEQGRCEGLRQRVDEQRRAAERYARDMQDRARREAYCRYGGVGCIPPPPLPPAERRGGYQSAPGQSYYGAPEGQHYR